MTCAIYIKSINNQLKTLQIMKKLFRLFAIAAVAAGAMTVASCGGNETGENGKPLYTITTAVNDKAMGTVSGAGKYEEGTTVTLTAVPNQGYEFVEWAEDHTKSAKRDVVVSKNETFTANFKEKPATGISVTFGTDSWTSNEGCYDMKYYGSYEAIVGRFFDTPQQLPYIDFALMINQAGTYTDEIDMSTLGYSDAINYLEYGKDGQFQDGSGNYYGDWWAYSATINVSALDLNALTVSMNISAVMFDCYTYLTTQEENRDNLSMSINNIAMGAAKGAFRK